MATSSDQFVVVPEPLATEVANLAWEFNRVNESTQDIRSDQLRAMARELDRMATEAEAAD